MVCVMSCDMVCCDVMSYVVHYSKIQQCVVWYSALYSEMRLITVKLIHMDALHIFVLRSKTRVVQFQ